MASSKQLAGLVGPTIVAMIVSEFPSVQPHLYDTQIPPVVYLSGVLMFVAGLAIVRVHNRWAWDWTVRHVGRVVFGDPRLVPHVRGQRLPTGCGEHPNAAVHGPGRHSAAGRDCSDMQGVRPRRHQRKVASPSRRLFPLRPSPWICPSGLEFTNQQSAAR